VAYAILAPSSHNSQPWHFVVQERSLLLCADRTRALPVVDPFDRELTISCGAALFNLRVALSWFDEPYRIVAFPYGADADVLAEVFLEADGYRDASLAGLFDAMRVRVTNRGDFEPEPVALDLQDALRKAAAEEGTGLACLEAEELRSRAAELVAEGDRLQFADPRFRRELASWIHGSRKHDGMPAYALNAGPLVDAAAPLVSSVIRTFDVGSGAAASHRRLVQGSPLLLSLGTALDNAENWLCAGQALERILLLAAAAGLGASHLNQAVEVPELRQRLRQLASAEAFPQILLRLGQGKPARHSPRRPLEEVLW
jgi:hypothetical protein